MILDITKRFLALDELSFGDYTHLWRASSDGVFFEGEAFGFYNGTIDIEFADPDKIYIWTPEDICFSTPS